MNTLHATNNRRASTILAMTALLSLLGILTTLIVQRSMESYRVSGILEDRLATHAAAQGAARYWAREWPQQEPLRIGDCHVEAIQSSSSGTLELVDFQVRVFRSGGFAHPVTFQALYAAEPESGNASLLALERN